MLGMPTWLVFLHNEYFYWYLDKYHDEENKEPIFDGPITREIMVNKLKELKKKKINMAGVWIKEGHPVRLER